MLRRVLYSQRKRLSHNWTKQEPTVLPFHFLSFSILKLACLGNKASYPLWEWETNFIVEWRMFTCWWWWQLMTLISKFAASRATIFILCMAQCHCSMEGRECFAEKMLWISLILRFLWAFLENVFSIKKIFLKKNKSYKRFNKI